MTWHLHHCTAEGCPESILVTARTEYPLSFAARATVLHAEGWVLRLDDMRLAREHALCPRHRDMGPTLCSRCGRTRCCAAFHDLGPLPALGVAVRVSGRRVVKTYGAPAGAP